MKAQDIHFSQFYTTPLLVNPANTGFFNCDYRFTANYRSQWKSIPVPYNTFTVSADLRLVKSHRYTGKNILGIGFVASVDDAGDSKLTTTQFAASVAYHKDLDRNHTQFLGAGIMVGYTNATIDYSGLIFSDQNSGTPGVLNTTRENISLNSLNFFDLAAGVAYNFVPNYDNNFTIGAAAYHINEPEKSFLNNTKATLPRKYVLNTGAEFKLGEHLQLLPKVMFELQGPSMELDLGSLIRVNIDKMDNSMYGIYFGAFYRLNDAVIFVTRFDVDKFSFAFSYDLNVSALTAVSDSKGGPELSLIYIGCFKTKTNKPSLYCPRF